jgi:hypothetical protein
MFELSGHQALVKSCKGYRGKSDEASSGIECVLEVENVIASNVAALLGVKDAAPIHGSFFAPLSENSTTEDKIYPGLDYISVSYFSEGHHQVTFGKFGRERIAWLGSIKLNPRQAGRFDVKFRLNIEEPQDGLMDWLRDNINRSVRVVLECDPGFDFQIKSKESPVTMDLPLPEQTDGDKVQLEQAVSELSKPRGRKRGVGNESNASIN